MFQTTRALLLYRLPHVPRIFRQQPRNSNSSDNERLKDDNSLVIHLDGVTVREFESLLTFH